MKEMRSQKPYACLIVALLLFVAGITASSLAQQGDIQRQKEISLFWRTVMNQLNNIDIARLDKMVSKNQGDDRQPVRASIALILDQGKLRPVSNDDRSLEPNHYMTLLFEKDFVHRTWSIVALDNQNFYRKSFSYSDGIEIMYAFDNGFCSGYIAKSAKAYRNGQLLAQANAMRRIETTIPYQMEIKEIHYNKNGKSVYTGMLTISLGTIGEITKESAVSGKKTSQVFNTWATGNR